MVVVVVAVFVVVEEGHITGSSSGTTGSSLSLSFANGPLNASAYG